MPTVIEFDYVPAHFRFTIAGGERILPVLEGASLARWHSRYASDKLAGFVAIADAIEARDLDEVLGASERMTDAMVEALIAYDATGVLGDREWLEANLTEGQLMVILGRILRAHA